MTYPAHYQRNSCTDETCKQCENYYVNAKRCNLHKIAPHAQATCLDNTLTIWKKSDEYKLMIAAENSGAVVEYVEPENTEGRQGIAALIEMREWLDAKHAAALGDESPEKNIVAGFEAESIAVIAVLEAHASECVYLQGWQDYLKALKCLVPVEMLIARGMIKFVEREALDSTIRARLHIDPNQAMRVLDSLAGMEVRAEQMEVKIKTSFGQLDLFGIAA